MIFAWWRAFRRTAIILAATPGGFCACTVQSCGYSNGAWTPLAYPRRMRGASRWHRILRRTGVVDTLAYLASHHCGQIGVLEWLQGCFGEGGVGVMDRRWQARQRGEDHQGNPKFFSGISCSHDHFLLFVLVDAEPHLHGVANSGLRVLLGHRLAVLCVEVAASSPIERGQEGQGRHRGQHEADGYPLRGGQARISVQ